MRTFAIIPSGGKGKRIGSDTPKQYLKIHGEYLITYTLRLFHNCKKIDEIIIPAEPEYFDLLEKIKKENRFSKITKILSGGSARQESVYNALKSIKADENDLIAVHDAARPLLDKKILSDALNSAEKFDNAVTAIKARDTIVKRLSDSPIEYLDREHLYYVQTPQIFKYKILLAAFEKALSENFVGTDESTLVNRTGKRINFIEGNYKNFKVTNPEDLEFLKHLFSKDC
ncbi:MAG: 2-C-methyl-D-erythritol 4-phosphate cytidylyltransferase [Chlorobi bacterium]|nr:2-C-methyl-D-erythritol 4-phosphate cytidylyltransferase [Chlorobiota bacterium]